jgi:hypothetical protein
MGRGPWCEGRQMSRGGPCVRKYAAAHDDGCHRKDKRERAICVGPFCQTDMNLEKKQQRANIYSNSNPFFFFKKKK